VGRGSNEVVQDPFERTDANPSVWLDVSSYVPTPTHQLVVWGQEAAPNPALNPAFAFGGVGNSVGVHCPPTSVSANTAGLPLTSYPPRAMQAPAVGQLVASTVWSPLALDGSGAVIPVQVGVAAANADDDGGTRATAARSARPAAPDVRRPIWPARDERDALMDCHLLLRTAFRAVTLRKEEP
jgi:hypothetical protein